jgi:hypothetical protein
MLDNSNLIMLDVILFVTGKASFLGMFWLYLHVRKHKRAAA